MTLEQITNATGASLKTATLFLPYIEETLNKYHISTPIRQLCFLAQVGHESGGLFYTEELASGKAYEGRKDLGNTQIGDGIKYKGKGLIQITGRANFDALSKEFGVDFVNIPSLLAGKNAKVSSPTQLRYSTLSAGWFWNSRNLNHYADAIDIQKNIDVDPNLSAFKLITKKINGAYNGLADRLTRYHNGLKYFI